MATTFIKPLRSQVHLKNALDYAMDEKKTDDGLYNVGVNCECYFAYEEYKDIQEKFDKKSGIVGYHLTQNFEENSEKLTPDVANEIGIKFAERMFPNFQVTVSTHINTEHIHNHIIINAVSYKDGRKYYDNDKSKQRIREISDSLCKEYDIHFLEKTKNFQRYYRKDRDKYTKLKGTDYRNTHQYAKWRSEHLNRNEIMKNDIDMVIENSKSFNEFIHKMNILGYEIKYENRQHIKFKFPGADNYRKGYVLGEEYTEDKIRQRIKEQEEILKTEEVVPDKYREFNGHKFAIYFDMVQVNHILYNAEKNEKIYKNDVYNTFVNDIKKANLVLYSIYKQNPTLEYNPNSNYYYREQKAIERINVAIRNIHAIDEYKITGSKKMYEVYTNIEEKKNALGKKIKRLRKEMDIVNKKVVAIKKYSQLKKNSIEGFEINELKNYLLYYDLLDEDKQDNFILKAENYNERFTKITSDYEKICSQYREISILKKDYEEIQNKKDKDEHKH